MILTDEIKNRVTNLYTNIITLKMEIENKNKELELLRNKLNNNSSDFTEDIEPVENKIIENETPILNPQLDKPGITSPSIDTNQTEITIPSSSQTQEDFTTKIKELTQKLELKDAELIKTKQELNQLKQELKKTKQDLEKTTTELKNVLTPQDLPLTPNSSTTISEDQKREFEKNKEELFLQQQKNTKLRSESILLINENTRLKLELKGKKG